MNKRLKLGFLGGGSTSMIGVLHRIASHMYEQYEIVGGVLSSNPERAAASANQMGIRNARIYPDLDTLIAEEIKRPVAERMEVIAVLTPNYLHFPMAKKLLESGFHVICEKPLTTTFEEAETLAELQRISKKVFAVTYTYTGYPMVRQMREMIRNGELGRIQKIDVQYYQGWINPIIHDLEKRRQTWRLNPEISGKSCCMGDIGTHAFQLVEFATGLQVEKVLADLNYLYEDNKMDIDGTVLIRCNNGVKGVIRASQIATGEENNFTVQIYGDKAGIRWEQENPNQLLFMPEDKPKQIYKTGNAYNYDFSRESTKLPPGHPEGIFDAMANIYHGVAQAIKGKQMNSGAFPTLNDGLRGMLFIEKVLKSHQNGNVWQVV